jgi:hypothetical protein
MVRQMANALAPSVKPFVDRVLLDRSSADGLFFRVGYRTEGTDYVLSAVDLPVQILEQEVASGLQLVTTVTPSGEVVSQIVGSSGLTLPSPRSTPSIHNLVSQTVSRHNLRLEEASTSELCDLLKTLEAAIDDVRAALSQTCSET